MYEKLRGPIKEQTVGLRPRTRDGRTLCLLSASRDGRGDYAG